MMLLPDIEDFFMSMYRNFNIVLSFVIAVLIVIGIYIYTNRKPTPVIEGIEVPARLESNESLHMANLLNEIAKNYKQYPTAKGPQGPYKSASISRNKFCYTDLINPFKYVTPPIQTSVIF